MEIIVPSPEFLVMDYDQPGYQGKKGYYLTTQPQHNYWANEKIIVFLCINPEAKSKNKHYELFSKWRCFGQDQISRSFGAGQMILQ